MNGDPQGVLGIFVAALGGAAVGTERQWSGHATFAGIRTFTLLGGLAGVAGWVWEAGMPSLAVVLLSGAVALVVVAYGVTSRRDAEGTTEVAALVVLAAGIVAGMGQLTLASGIVAVTSLLLVEKSVLHGFVARLDDAELRAGARFAVMAVVILPMLPVGPYGPLGGVRPRGLWTLVLIFSGLDFAGYIARRTIGARHGYQVAGLLGGLVSSTAVTLTFARRSRDRNAPEGALAVGAIAASAIMPIRIGIVATALSPALGRAVLPYLWAPLLAGAVVAAIGLRRNTEGAAHSRAPRNPLNVFAAVRLALVFQLALFTVQAAQQWFGRAGILASGALLGLTDVDALVVSLARTGESVPLETAALAVAIGILANTVLKLVFALALGRGRFRGLVGFGLAATAAATVASIVVVR